MKPTGDLRKEAPAFDLAVALGIVVVTRQLEPQAVLDSATTGELALDGSLRPVKVVLAMAMWTLPTCAGKNTPIGH